MLFVNFTVWYKCRERDKIWNLTFVNVFSPTARIMALCGRWKRAHSFFRTLNRTFFQMLFQKAITNHLCKISHRPQVLPTVSYYLSSLPLSTTAASFYYPFEESLITAPGQSDQMLQTSCRTVSPCSYYDSYIVMYYNCTKRYILHRSSCINLKI